MKNLKNFDFDNKRVIVRCDFNVPVSEGVILDDFRLHQTIPTIEFLKKNNAKVILVSHLGDPKGKDLSLSLEPVASKLKELTGYDVRFIEDCIGEIAEREVEKMESGDVVLLENLRFYIGETENNEDFAGKLARLGDYFVQDGFGVCHRNHASVVSLPKLLPSFPGLNLEKEIDVLSKALENSKRPLVAIIGGAKIKSKASVIKKLLEKADAVLLGGKIGNTVLTLKGLYGEARIDDPEILASVKDINFESDKLLVPVDGIMAMKTCLRAGDIETMSKGEEIYDIGKKTTDLYKKIIASAGTIIWNGPVGVFEKDAYNNGTEEIGSAVVSSKAFTIIGGGETVEFINRMGWGEKVGHLSSGGGAMLEFLAGAMLPGIEVLNRKRDED